MKKLDRFLLSSFVGPFFLTFFIVVFVLALQMLWLYIDELVGKGLGLGVIFEFMGWASATLIPLALPLATLLASIMTLGGMGEHNELLAMKAAGISLKRILVPLIVLSGGISIGAFFASNDLIPVAYQKIYTLRQDIVNTKEEIKIPPGTFYDGIEGYVLRMEGQNEETKMMYNLVIYDHTSNKGNVSMTLADSGKMVITPDKRKLIFDLYNGCSYQESNSMLYRDTTLTLQRLFFKEQTLMISLENYAFTRTEGNIYGDEVMSQDLESLRQDRDSLSNQYDTLFGTQYRRYISGSGLDYLYQLDTARNQRIKGIFQLDTLYASIQEDGELDAIRLAIDKSYISAEVIQNFKGEDYRYIDPIRRIDIESHRKFTLSIACLIFFFIGAPLGAIIRKGGLGTPVIISIFFFLVYYIIDITGKKLARDGAITPFEGTFVATAVLLPIGVFLTWKSTRDSSLFNIESYKLFFTNIWSSICEFVQKVKNLFKKEGGKIRIVYMGTPEFAVAPLRSLIESKYEIVGVVTVPDKQSGRGLKVTESAVKQYANEHNLKVLQPVSLKDPAFLEELKSLKANLFVVVAFRMLPKEVWSMPRLGTFNLHASLLPQYRGAAPINWAIINGEHITGVTTFMIDEQIDTGNIIFQEQCAIESFDNIGSLHDKLQAIGSELVVKTVKTIANGKLKTIAQESYDHLNPAPKITKETCRINWNKQAITVDRLIRGLSPYPAAYSTLSAGDESINVKIYDAFVTESQDVNAPVGTIFSDGKSYLEVKCKYQSIKILSLQIAGKKRLNIKEFLAGFREPEKYKFV